MRMTKSSGINNGMFEEITGGKADVNCKGRIGKIKNHNKKQVKMIATIYWGLTLYQTLCLGYYLHPSV